MRCTAQVTDTFCKYLRNGNFFEIACKAAGIDEATAYNWMRLGNGETVVVQTPSGPRALKTHKAHADFFEAVTRAMVDAENDMVLIMKAGARFGPGVHNVNGQSVRVGDHRAASEFLRRRYPERWNRLYKHEKSEQTVKTISVNAADQKSADAIAAQLSADPEALDLAHRLAEKLNVMHAEKITGGEPT